jgi:hypothetical protein
MITKQFPNQKEIKVYANIRVFKLDNAGEFKSNKWTYYCKNKGIICEYTSPYSPSQNGIAERLNRYLVERLISVSKAKKIPLFLWPQLLEAIAHIKNRSYNSVIEKTPYEALYDKRPNIDYIKILGSLTYVLKNKKEHKLEEKSEKGILIGFESANNFLVYIPRTRKIISSKNVSIKENLIYKDDITDENDYSDCFELIRQEDYNYDTAIDTRSYEYNDEPEESIILSGEELAKEIAKELDNTLDKSDSEDNDEVGNDENDEESDIEEVIRDDIEEDIRPNIPIITIRKSRKRKDYSNEVPNVTTRLEAKNNPKDKPKSLSYLIKRLNNRKIQEQKEALTIFKNIQALATFALISSKSEENLQPDLNKITKTNEQKILIKKTANLDIYEPKSYKEAINSPYKECRAK